MHRPTASFAVMTGKKDAPFPRCAAVQCFRTTGWCRAWAAVLMTVINRPRRGVARRARTTAHVSRHSVAEGSNGVGTIALAPCARAL